MYASTYFCVHLEKLTWSWNWTLGLQRLVQCLHFSNIPPDTIIGDFQGYLERAC